jgi:hypothetical protein
MPNRRILASKGSSEAAFARSLLPRWRSGHEGKLQECKSSDAGRICAGDDHRTVGTVHAVEPSSGEHTQRTHQLDDAAGARDGSGRSRHAGRDSRAKADGTRAGSDDLSKRSSIHDHGETARSRNDSSWRRHSRNAFVPEACSRNDSGWARYSGHGCGS